MSGNSKKKCLDDRIIVDTSNAPFRGCSMIGVIVGIVHVYRPIVKH